MFKIGTLNKISPKGLAKLGDNYQIIDDVNEADGILVRSFKMHDMEFSPNLKAIARAGAGVNNIPLDRCAEEGIVVFNTPGANANAVKELVFAAMFAEARNIVNGVEWVNGLEPAGISEAVEKGKSNFAGTELAGKKIAVIGLGAIGVSVANTAADIGMEVVGYDPYMSVASALHLYSSISVTDDMAELLADADYVTVHIPALANTKGMINAETFAKLTKPAKLLNFSRAEIVNADDMEKALSEGKISKYITDFPTEPVVNVAPIAVASVPTPHPHKAPPPPPTTIPPKTHQPFTYPNLSLEALAAKCPPAKSPIPPNTKIQTKVILSPVSSLYVIGLLAQ